MVIGPMVALLPGTSTEKPENKVKIICSAPIVFSDLKFRQQSQFKTVLNHTKFQGGRLSTGAVQKTLQF